MPPSSFTDRLVARLVPRSLAEADENTRRRARLVVLFSFAIFLCGPGYGAVYLLLGMRVSALGAGVAAAVLFATPFVQRRTGSVALGAHLVAFGCYAALALVTAPTGGLSAPAVAWLALVPVTALMLGGASAGRVWTAISLATVVGYFALEATGRTPASEVPPAWLRELRLVVNFGLVVLIAWLAWLYEANKDRMLAVVQSANTALARARDDAEAAHRSARLVLDNVAQGLLVVDREGRIVGERSRFAAQLFGEAALSGRLSELFEASDPSFATRLRLGWEAVFDDGLPQEVALAQLPVSCRLGAKTLAFEYVPVASVDGALQQILVVISDDTARAAALDLERKQREQLEVFRWIVTDGAYFAKAFDELDALAHAVLDGGIPWQDRLRLLHTLKGNAGVFGLSTLARHCHDLEEQVKDRLQTSLTDAQRSALEEAWRAARTLVEPLLGGRRCDLVAVPVAEYQTVLAEVAARDPRLHARLQGWAWEPARSHLERLATQAKTLATRLLGARLTVVVEDDGTRWPPEQAAFWAYASHLVRNAIDHGIESPELREAAGKPDSGKLTLRAHARARELVVEVEDDGRGVDWDRVKLRARELGLPVESPHDLERALFADGLSTREESTETSGRGIGMAALRAHCAEMGATIEVTSQRGSGTRVRVAIPLDPARQTAA